MTNDPKHSDLKQLITYLLMILQFGKGLEKGPRRFCSMWHQPGQFIWGWRYPLQRRLALMTGQQSWLWNGRLVGAISPGFHSSQCGLPMLLGWTPQKLGSVKENPRSRSPVVWALVCKHLSNPHFASQLLMSHWPQRVTWQSPDLVWEETALHRNLGSWMHHGSLGATCPLELWNSVILCLCFSVCRWLCVTFFLRHGMSGSFLIGSFIWYKHSINMC